MRQANIFDVGLGAILLLAVALGVSQGQAVRESERSLERLQGESRMVRKAASTLMELRQQTALDDSPPLLSLVEGFASGAGIRPQLSVSSPKVSLDEGVQTTTLQVAFKEIDYPSAIQFLQAIESSPAGIQVGQLQIERRVQGKAPLNMSLQLLKTSLAGPPSQG